MKPEEYEMDPVEETEFSDCGSIQSEGIATTKLLFSIKQIPILQRAINMVQQKVVTEHNIEPGMRRQTLLKIIDENVKIEENIEKIKQEELMEE